MGQVHSRFEKLGGLWQRRKPKAATRKPPQESFTRTSPPPPADDRSSARTEQFFTQAAPRSSTRDNTIPATAAPPPDTHSDDTHCDAMTANNDKVGGAGHVDKVEDRTDDPQGHPTADKPDKPDKPAQPAQVTAGEPTSSRPALKREYTPPHRIRLLTTDAWRVEHVYGNVHEHITKSLNQIRKQQVEAERKNPKLTKLDEDVYKAADSCTLSLEYLVGNFSTAFFNYPGPENLVSMMATIEADASGLDELRLKQLQIANYGYNLERKIKETEAHIRELGDLAKRIKEGDVRVQEDGEADADGETDPEADGQEDKNGGSSC